MFVLPYIDFTFFSLLEVCDVLHSSHDVYRIALYFSFLFFFHEIFFHPRVSLSEAVLLPRTRFMAMSQCENNQNDDARRKLVVEWCQIS